MKACLCCYAIAAVVVMEEVGGQLKVGEVALGYLLHQQLCHHFDFAAPDPDQIVESPQL